MVSRTAKQLVRVQLRAFSRRNQQSATPTLFAQLACGAPGHMSSRVYLSISLCLPTYLPSCVNYLPAEYLNAFTGRSAVSAAVFQQTLFSQTRQRFGDRAVAPSEKHNMLRV